MKSVIRHTLAGAAVLAAAMPTVATAQSAGGSKAALVDRLLGARPRSAPVSTFSVAGVTLGMSPTEARAALAKAGFTPRAEDPTQDSWSTAVSRRAAERTGGKVETAKVPMFTMAEGSQGEHVEVWYAATPEGPKAVEVKYQMPTNRMERAAFLTGTAARYGRPTTESPSGGVYCTRDEPSCMEWENKVLPYMRVDSSYSIHEIYLSSGRRYGDELKARMAAAVEAVAPKSAKASF